MTTNKDILTTDDVASMMGCAPTTIEEHARNRVLPGIRMGHEWRFPRAALMEAINTLAVTGELHRTSAKRKPQAAATGKEQSSGRRRPIPVLPRLQPSG